MFSHRHRRASDVSLLEGISADRCTPDLASNRNHGNRVHHRRRETGDQVSRTGARGRDRYAHFARSARETVRCMGRALLMPDQDVAQLRIATQHAVEREDRTAREAEHQVNTLVEKCFADDLAASQFLGHLKCFVSSVI